MVSNTDSRQLDSIQEDAGFDANGTDNMTQLPVQVCASKDGFLLSGQATNQGSNPRNPLHSLLVTFPRLKKIMGQNSDYLLPSPSAKFKRIAKQRDQVSRSVSALSSGDKGPVLNVPFLGKINWDAVKTACKTWIRDPMNMALFIWIVAVAVSGAILFMVMTGMLNRELRTKSQRDIWFEVNNQILNALFTLMCLYQHPKRFYHLALLCRWKADDILKLRKVYCKNGTYKPHEWTHMMIVVVLLHINCFGQYALCGLNWGYRRSQRPPIGVGICISIAICAPAIAGIYCIVSPLGKEYLDERDLEAEDVSGHSPIGKKTLEKTYSFVSGDEQKAPETRPLWIGGLFDLWDDISLAYLSLFCSFCVFGWNMERLGFGNMYVHIATFILLCLAPFWIFNVAAINIDNEYVREGLGLTGIVLCIFGLLYGGFWRIQMRKRYNLPANGFCCGRPAVTDCMQWLCCCVCSLAQEVRTGNFYEIKEEKFYRKNVDNESQQDLYSLPCEDGSTPLFRSVPSSPPCSNTPVFEISTPSPYHPRIAKDDHIEKHASTSTEVLHCNIQDDETMKAPAPPMIEKE